MTPFVQLDPVWRGALLTAALLVCFASLYALVCAVALRTGARRVGRCAALFAAACLTQQWLYDAAWRAERGRGFLPGRGQSLGQSLGQSPAAAAALLLLALSFLTALCIERLYRWRRTRISPMSIKEGIEHLPTGLCFCDEGGLVLLTNRRMSDLCHAITGGALLDAGAFWGALSSGRVQGGATALQCAPSPLVRLGDARVYSFARRRLSLKGRVVFQITAADVTEQYRLSDRLQSDNRRLRAMNDRLRRYGKTVREVAREREVLSAKVRLHDRLGRTLLAARRALGPSASRGDRAALMEGWRRDVALICHAPDDAPDASNFERLTQAAGEIGVSVHFRGAPPPAGTGAARLMEGAVRECLTNTVRHARGTRLYVDIRRGDGWTLALSNDGRAPDGPIAEGGGLGALRASVEGAGGTMRVRHAPRFTLALSIPEESEEFIL